MKVIWGGGKQIWQMDNTSSIKLIKRRVIRGNKHVIKLILVRLGGRDYRQTMTSPSIQESLKRISKLEFFTVRQHVYSHSRFDWSSNPIRPALLHLLHLPTLTHFKMFRIINFIISDLIPCINLKYLDIGDSMTVADENTFPASFPEHSIQLNEFVAEFGSSTAIMKLCTARRPDGQPIIDFGSLSKISVDIGQPNDGEASQELFRRCHILTYVNIYCKW